MKTEIYRFNKAKHLHQLLVDGEWKNLTGCTTVLSVIAKPALIQWAANMAVNYIRENAPEEMMRGMEHRIVSEIILEEARKAHTKRKEKAGTWGTKTHEEIEKYINFCIAKEDLKIECFDERINQFIKWADDNKVEFLASEKNIYSEKLFIGGIVDFVCEIDGKRWIGDIKTSGSGIYPEHFWQCAGYDLMLQEMGEPKADGYLILNLKENGEFLEKRSISNGDNTKAFMACLDIYRIQEKIKNQVL